MTRKIIKIDNAKCIGCGLCAKACNEGAIGMVNGKAKLLREDYCDGLGNCLPVCPTNAISFEVRDNVVQNTQDNKLLQNFAQGCPGTQFKKLNRKVVDETKKDSIGKIGNHLNQWPVQIKLVSPNAPYFNDSHLLIAADCTAYAYGDFHNQFMKNKITLIGCPKLDQGDYSEKLTEILALNNIKSLTVIRMEVPCCGGIESAVKTALQKSQALIPWQVVTISTDGRVLEI